MGSNESPNPIRVALAVIRAMRRRRPAPAGSGTVDHSRLTPVLETVASGGVTALPDLREELWLYRKHLQQVDPDALSHDEALAYWLNLYNAGALDLAADAHGRGDGSVLRVPGGFSKTWATVAGEDLSLDEIEHAKLRRFKDPRIHGALVCGSASCPTLRYEPYRGGDVRRQLDDQMRSFLRHGGAYVDRPNGTLSLSRIFLWYGADVARPHAMPTWIPTTRRRVYRGLEQWIDPEVRAWVGEHKAKIVYQPYDWSLACAVR